MKLALGMRPLLSRLLALVRRERLDAQLDHEVNAHLDLLAAEHERHGMTPDEARHAARRAFGGVEPMKERHRDRRGLPWVDGAARDLRYVARVLARNPGFTAVAVLVFGLGIGINTALFSLTNALFFRPLAAEDPHRLVHVYDVNGAGRMSQVTPYGALEYFRDHGELFASMTTHWAISQRLTVDDETELTPGEFVAGNYFDVLGVRARLGRTLQIADDLPSGDVTAMVISSRLWERRFSSDPGVVGRRVQLCCRPWISSSALDPVGEFEIVGVMPSAFKGVAGRLSASDFWVPARWTGGDRTVIGLLSFGRLKADVSLDQAQVAVRHTGEIFLDDRRRDLPPSAIEAWRGRRFEARPTAALFNPFAPQDTTIARQATAMTILIGVVLLIAASNVAGLLTARSAHRASEIAIRAVIGATRWHVGRLLVMESVLLALAGGALGLAIASWALELFRAYTPGQMAIDTPMDASVLLVTLATCLGAGVLTGLAPAIRACRVDILATLPGAGVTRSRQARTRLRHALLIPQVALSLAVLTVAGLHVRSLVAMETADLGYETDQRVVMNVSLRPQRGDTGANRDQQALRSRTFYRQLVQQVRALTGPSAIAFASALPLSPFVPDSQEVIAEETFSAGARSGVSASQASVSAGYFQTMGIRLLEGRDFDERDVRLEARNGATEVPGGLVAIVSRSLARRLWDGRDPLGRSLALVSTWSGNANQSIDWRRVIGVVDEVRPMLDADTEVPFLYMPLGQAWQTSPNRLVAHVPGRPEPLVAQLKRAVTGASPFAEVYETRMLEQLADEMLFQHRAITALLAISGAIGLLLACVGLYGVMSYAVARRTHELGVRSALGARRTDIVGLVMREGAAVTLLGMAIGGFLTFAALRVGANAPIRPDLDGATVVAVSLALAAAVFAACYIPARRAARVDPLESLRAL